MERPFCSIHAPMDIWVSLSTITLESILVFIAMTANSSASQQMISTARSVTTVPNDFWKGIFSNRCKKEHRKTSPNRGRARLAR